MAMPLHATARKMVKMQTIRLAKLSQHACKLAVSRHGTNSSYFQNKKGKDEPFT
jgi:hypothetical protein